MKQVGNNKLKKNFSAWAIFSIVNNTKLNGKAVVGWRIVAGKKVTVDLFIRVIRKFRNEIVIRAIDAQGRNKLANLVAGADKFNIFLPDDMVLFQSKIKAVDDGDVTVAMPEMIAQIDRRKYLRLFVTEEIKADVNFFKQSHNQHAGTQNFTKPCFDISAGGLSFIISRMESKFFQKDDYINNMTIRFDDEEIEINGHVVNILEIAPDERNNLHYKGWKVCVKYQSIDAESQKRLNDFVFKYVDITDEAM
jgi:c-di-GMP-binding flagellar brake protein YcgR